MYRDCLGYSISKTCRSSRWNLKFSLEIQAADRVLFLQPVMPLGKLLLSASAKQQLNKEDIFDRIIFLLFLIKEKI